MSAVPAFLHLCRFSIGNFTYLFRCRVIDQYCCGHTCCFKDVPFENEGIFASWYFWSLILVVFVVFGCIIASFVLSSLKHRQDFESWTAFAGSTFNNLATTVTGKHGIIQPRLHYRKKKKQQQSERPASEDVEPGNNNNNPGLPSVSASVSPPAVPQPPRSVASAPQLTRPPRPKARPGAAAEDEWVEVQLSPLHPAYKSSWTGNADEIRLAASTQLLFPPGFINS